MSAPSDAWWEERIDRVATVSCERGICPLCGDVSCTDFGSSDCASARDGVIDLEDLERILGITPPPNPTEMPERTAVAS